MSYTTTTTTNNNNNNTNNDDNNYAMHLCLYDVESHRLRRGPPYASHSQKRGELHPVPRSSHGRFSYATAWQDWVRHDTTC